MAAEGAAVRAPEEHEARGRRRLRRAAATSASSLVARFASFGAFALLVPITLPYLGAERYGVWMTLLSLVALIGITDFGMGNALVSIVARLDTKRDAAAAGRYVSTAVALSTVIGLGLGAIAVVVFPFVPWESVFKVASGPIASEAGKATAVLLVIYLINLPAGIVGPVRRGFQEGYANAWWETVASVVTVAAVALAVYGDAGLVAVMAAAAVAPLLTNLANWVLLVRRRPALRPNLRNVTRAEARSLSRAGGLFFVLQIAIVVGFTSDNFVAAQVLGPDAVTDYSIPSRLALAGMSLIAIFVTPLWPAFAEALARSDHAWVIRVLRRSVATATVVAAGGALVFIAAGKPIIRAWTRGEVDPGWLLLIGLGLFIVLGTIGTAVSMFLNAAHVVGLQVVCATLMAVSNISLSIFLAGRIGVAGLIWGTSSPTRCSSSSPC